MKTLHLTLKTKYFQAILRREKKEEYRECKPYWATRLQGKSFDLIKFRLGYRRDAPTMTLVCRGIETRIMTLADFNGGRPCLFFVLRLGTLLEYSSMGYTLATIILDEANRFKPWPAWLGVTE